MTSGQKAIFLDRDGVLIHDVHYLSNLEEIQFYPDVPDGLRRLKDAGFLLVVVTNQSGVARKYFPREFVNECHVTMNRFLDSYGVKLDHLYYCPHHVDGHPPLNIDCDCRKPAPGLILQAEKELDLELNQTVMIGDKQSDIELAVNAGIPGILLTTGQGEAAHPSVSARFPETPVFPDFMSATEHILTVLF